MIFSHLQITISWFIAYLTKRSTALLIIIMISPLLATRTYPNSPPSPILFVIKLLPPSCWFVVLVSASQCLSSSFLLCASVWSSASSAMLHSALSVPVSVKSTKSSYLKLYLAHSLVYFPVLAFTSFFASPFSAIFVLVAIDSSLKTFLSLHLVFSTSLYSFLPSPF